jgi:hypothetical protein
MLRASSKLIPFGPEVCFLCQNAESRRAASGQIWTLKLTRRRVRTGRNPLSACAEIMRSAQQAWSKQISDLACADCMCAKQVLIAVPISGEIQNPADGLSREHLASN